MPKCSGSLTNRYAFLHNLYFAPKIRIFTVRRELRLLPFGVFPGIKTAWKMLFLCQLKCFKMPSERLKKAF